MTGRSLTTPLSHLKGVGEVVNQQLAALGLDTVADLLDYFPRRYDDFSKVQTIAQLRPGLVTVRAKVEHLGVRASFKRKGMTITEVVVSDATGSLKLTWFQSPWILQQLKKGEWYFFLGDLKFASNQFGITQASFEPAPEATSQGKKAGSIVPIYNESAKVTSTLLRKLIDQILPIAEQLVDELPADTLTRQQLLTRAEAYRQLHQPVSSGQLTAARHRMAFTELFLHLAAGLSIKQELSTEVGIPIPLDAALAKQFTAQLPYHLTDDQRRVAMRIFDDLAQSQPMNRLLEGDVGSGKTVVAAFVALMAIRAGHQVAIMVPTDILARQHQRTLKELLAAWGLQPALLTSKMPAADRRIVRDGLADGSIELVVGTQALITKQAEFDRLGLVVIDEQHRFGVKQRLTLKDKAGRLPHVLTMTATPIPRTLALVMYGDLSISTIKQLPPGRKPVDTKVVFERDRAKIEHDIDGLIEKGQQIYIVCPAIDETDTGGMKAVSTEFRRLQRTVFAHRRVGLLHGKLKSEDKARVMERFAAGLIDILVATTVIEVGVHVANASVMVVEGAERFGLATLHQLRGRVGRGSAQSYCYLFLNTADEASVNRVRALERTHDGFRLAQVDLENRGPGQIYGVRQAGKLDLRFATLHDSQLIAAASQAALAFLAGDNIVKYPYTIERINRLKTVTSLD